MSTKPVPTPPDFGKILPGTKVIRAKRGGDWECLNGVRIRQNAWGNWSGYYGRTRAFEFGNDDRAAREWMFNHIGSEKIFRARRVVSDTVCALVEKWVKDGCPVEGQLDVDHSLVMNEAAKVLAVSNIRRDQVSSILDLLGD